MGILRGQLLVLLLVARDPMEGPPQKSDFADFQTLLLVLRDTLGKLSESRPSGFTSPAQNFGTEVGVGIPPPESQPALKSCPQQGGQGAPWSPKGHLWARQEPMVTHGEPWALGVQDQHTLQAAGGWWAGARAHQL